MNNADTKGQDESPESVFHPFPLPQMIHPVISTSQAYPNNAAYNQGVNFNPSNLNFYHGCPYGSNSVSPFVSNAPLAPSYLSVPGVPQYASSPGFLTGAGYQFNLGLPHLVGLQYHGSYIPQSQVGLPLHAATIVGDKQKVIELLQDESTNLECRDRWGRVALVYAVLGNHHEVVEILLQAGARPDAADAQKCTPLHYAAYKGNHVCIKSILHAVETKASTQVDNQGGVWLAQDMRGVTPLHHAAHHTNQKCLQTLLKYALPGTLDSLDHKKRTPLHWAAAYGSDENVRLLIKYGANNLMPDQEGKTPLHWAAMSKTPGSKGCVRTLIGAAPSGANWQDFDGITALHLAVAEARLDAVDVILSVPKCSVDVTDNQFRTALHWACSRGVTSIVGRLLDRGAHLGAVDVYGATPLHYAAQLNHADTVDLLVRRPCVRDDPCNEGHTALLWAAARGADLAITGMVRHGASLTKVDPRGCTPLHIAAGAGHVSTVGVLLRLRAPPDVCAADGRTPLLHAAQAGHAQIVKLLAKAGASLDHRDNEGQCALHHAVLSGHLYLAQILIRAGTSVNVQDYSGRTPLHMAAYRGLSDIMFLLLENRGDVNARDHEGQSPLHWAAQQGHLGAVNTLLDFHAYPNYTQSTINRYTPLDCAYVAEQLEIAQVLMEAGGLSVTKIMDIATVKIQAFIRGYLARKYYRKMKEYKRESLKRDPDMKKSNKVLKGSRSFVDAVIGKPYSVVGLETTTCEMANKHGRGSDTPAKKGLRFSEQIMEDVNVMLETNVDIIKAEPNPKPNPDKTVSRRRRSKMIASNIKAGARKKTVRELELPDPGELGIDKQASISKTNLIDSSSQLEEDFSLLKPPAQNTQHPIGQALFYPRNVVSALINANISLASEAMLNIDKNSKNNGEEISKEDSVESKKDCDEKNENDINPDEYVKEKDGTKLSNIETLHDDSFENTETSCKKEKDNTNVVANNKESKSVETAMKSKRSFHKHQQLNDKNREKQRIVTAAKHDAWDSAGGGDSFSCDEEEIMLLSKVDRKNALEERLAKSLEVAHREAKIPGNRDNRIPQRRVLSADARKHAEEKWNSKLASLTIQVQRPSSAKSATSFSYNLTTPKSSLKPTPKMLSVASLEN